MTPAISFDSVRKSFRGHIVLDAIRFDVMPGETVALIGANGAGKTTLIKCLLDLALPDAGVVTIFGVPARQPQARRPLVYLPERFAPPRHLTGREFLSGWFALLGAVASAKRLESVLDHLQLGRNALVRPVSTLSKGMAQKLGLAGLFAADKPLIVADEPTSGLDPQTRAAVKALFAEARIAGHSVLFTSHLIADVAELADRVAVLEAGRLAFFGTPARLMEETSCADIESAYLGVCRT